MIEKEETCPHCDQPWASQAHYDLQSCNCIHQTDDADPHTVLIAVADCAKRWVPEARIIGNVRAGDILKACNMATGTIKATLDTEWETREDVKTIHIMADHPARSGAYDTYVEALELVSNRKSKGSLVALVNHLLLEAQRAKQSSI